MLRNTENNLNFSKKRQKIDYSSPWQILKENGLHSFH